MALRAKRGGLCHAFGIEGDRQEGEGGEQRRKREREPQDRGDGRGDGKEAQHGAGHDGRRKGDPEPAAGAAAFGQPAENGILHDIEEAQQRQHAAQGGEREAVAVDIEFRGVDIDGQPRHGDEGGEQAPPGKPCPGRGGRQGRGHRVTSSGGGVGRLRNFTPLSASFSACQWISASTRRLPSGRRMAARRISPLVSGTRGPMRLV